MDGGGDAAGGGGAPVPPPSGCAPTAVAMVVVAVVVVVTAVESDATERSWVFERSPGGVVGWWGGEARHTRMKREGEREPLGSESHTAQAE